MPLRPLYEPTAAMSEHVVNCVDDEERSVIVRVSHDAVEEYGWETCFEVANAMFDAGRFNDRKYPGVVTVKVQDVIDWMAGRD